MDSLTGRWRSYWRVTVTRHWPNTQSRYLTDKWCDHMVLENKWTTVIIRFSLYLVLFKSSHKRLEWICPSVASSFIQSQCVVFCWLILPLAAVFCVFCSLTALIGWTQLLSLLDHSTRPRRRKEKKENNKWTNQLLDQIIFSTPTA